MSKKVIISVGRQLGSGGREIAKMLADTFDCDFYDREILNLAARESGFTEKIFEQHDERKGFFRHLHHVRLPLMNDNTIFDNRFSEEGLFQWQSEAIRHAAEQHSCVFVGRCADYILRDMPELVSIFVTAQTDYRIAKVCEREGCDAKQAQRIIIQAESQRAQYYHYYTGKRWGDSSSYNLCIDASLIGNERAAAMIAEYVREVRGL